MFNCLIDGFPTEYKGFKINTDYRVGILLTLLQEDTTIDEDIKLLQSINLLYAGEVPENLELALNGLLWFLSCGKSELYLENDYIEQGSNDKCIDFNLDQYDIWGAFWGKGIDLTTVNMHWFKFMSALGNVGDCPLSQKMQYRSADLSKLKGETKAYYTELKEKYKVRRVITKEEHEEELRVMKEKYGSYYMKLRELNGGR